MNMVDLQRTGRRGAACAAVAALTLFGSHQASAEVANPNLVPAKSAYIISVPDSSAFWSAWEANSLYSAYKDVMAMPEVESKVAGFRKELSIIESSLGFKLDGATLSQVFSSVDIYMTPTDEAGKLDMVALFEVADADKLGKLIDLAEKAAAQSGASDDGSTGTVEADDDKTSAIAETDYNGVKIKTFKSGDSDNKFIYARSDDFLFIASSEDGIKKAIDRAKADTPAKETVAASDDYKKIDAALASEKGEVYVYINQDLAGSFQAGKNMSASMANSMKSLMNDVAPVTYSGTSVKFAPKEISGYSYGLLKEGTSDSLLLKNPGDKPLAIAGYIPESTMFAGATSLFNAESIYGMAASVAKETGNDIDAKLEGAEAGLGFSVKNDLVPAMGNEIAFALNDVQFSGLIPKVDATIILSVKDKAKMQKVVDGVKRLATNAMASKTGDSGTSAPEFATEEVEGQTVNSMAISAIPGLAPGYVLTDNYLIIGSTKASLTNALEAAAGGKNLPNSAAFKALGHGISANANALQFVNITRMLDVAQQVTNVIPAVKPAGKFIEALKVVETMGSSSSLENGAVVSHSVIKLK